MPMIADPQSFGPTYCVQMYVSTRYATTRGFIQSVPTSFRFQITAPLPYNCRRPSLGSASVPIVNEFSRRTDRRTDEQTDRHDDDVRAGVTSDHALHAARVDAFPMFKSCQLPRSCVRQLQTCSHATHDSPTAGASQAPRRTVFLARHIE